VKALRNGKPFKAFCQVFKQADEEGKSETLDTDWTDVQKGASFNLAPGVYDLKVTDSDDAAKRSVDLKGITVEAGKAVEKAAEF
jgi:hypothetical protein